MPRAAEAYRRQITLGLEGDPRAALKARVVLREWFGGKIRLVPQLDGGLMAHWNLHPGASLKDLGTYGSGGALLAGWLVTPINQGDFSFSGLVISLLGAIVLLAIVNLFRRGRAR